MIYKTFNHIDTSSFSLPELQSIESANGRRYVLPNGHLVPSVTTVLSHFQQKFLSDWIARVGEDTANRIKTKAALRGTKFHDVMEMYLNNTDINIIFNKVFPDIKAAFLNVLPILNKIDNISVLEQTLYSDRLKIAGKTDVIGEFDLIPSIIDFKTATKVKKEEWIQHYFEQATAYSLMWEERTSIRIEQIVIIMFVDHSPQPELFIKNRKEYIIPLYHKIKEYHKHIKENI